MKVNSYLTFEAKRSLLVRSKRKLRETSTVSDPQKHAVSLGPSQLVLTISLTFYLLCSSCSRKQN